MGTPDNKLNDLELKVLDRIRVFGWEGRTVDELEQDLNLTHQCASARVNELAGKHGLIERRGIQRKTRSGRKAFVYVVKGLPQAAARVGEPDKK